MSILEILKAITDYGITLVLSGVVIYVVIKLTHIGFVRLQNKITRDEHDKALQLRSEIDEKVYEMLNNFVEDHHGLRLQVVEFTNSVTSVAYLPFRYMSCTYEVVSYGNKPEAMCIDKLSTSLFSPFLSKLSKQGYLVLNKEDTAQLSGVLEDLNNQIGGEHFISAIMKSEKDKCIGYVGLYKDKEVDTQDIDDLLIIASQISTLLGVLDK